MGAVVALDRLLDGQRLWRGPARQGTAGDHLPTGHPALDARLPGGGWPASGLCEVLQPAPGSGELALVWPVLARLSQRGQPIVLVAPPHAPHAPAWARAGLDLRQLQVVRADPRQALWAAEQCLRSAACAAVLCWPGQADDRALRRLQVAADSGQCLGLAFRDARAARNPSPATLRLQLEQGQVRVLKCRGGLAPPQPLPLARPH
ncbi:translesion DNA synthesis-associated protein ImuA [Stenotrophomonas sp. 24(2023)]|uniref:translesion DNA synthesis-associated protein ImuA n=1 Tax=Stenotrophomonas sp. 24(2023) TaxID=3068324 RepID=UPI0027E1DFF0|nr:translesion DNA synthesis-associated protein ImuA [Stenotrophomonas sp. 24(2023)]WMJ69580.1 translesion DNA synthesis-associated protein ImuA [Stenotrophomonas sp. 24(2023)]